MNRLHTLLLLPLLLLSTLRLSGQATPEAYRLTDARGRTVPFAQMIQDCARAEVVFFGELHNSPISHWMELRVLKALHELKGDSVLLGMEMLETDVQLILDEYLSRTISPKRYGDEARLWPNYETDYDPLVFFAKDRGLRVVATNVPRRYADLVHRRSLRALDSLSPTAKRYLPPLPIPYRSDSTTSGMFAAMKALGHGSSEPKYIEQAQAIKDATMGYFISRHLAPSRTLLHINGSYHSLAGSGIIPYLRTYAPRTRYVTISTVTQDELGSLEEEYQDIADYILIVPSDMITTH